MNSIVRYCAMLLVMVVAIPAFSDDQDKANKELVKVAAMAMDPTGRDMVSRAVADATGVKRADLVQQRQTMNLNYAQVFVVQTLVKNGAKLDDISAQLKAGKTVDQVANENHLNWKQMAGDAKKLNASIDDNLYKHFLNDKNLQADKQRNLDENYDVSRDLFTVDRNVPKPDMEAAAERYDMWKERAFKAGGQHKTLSTSDEQAAYYDHDRASPDGNSGGGKGSGGATGVGTAAPSGGGARTGPN
jgi:hypothetical protein